MSAAALQIPLSSVVPPVLAVGAFLKNTVCVTKGAMAYLSAVNGDLSTPEAILALERSVSALVAELDVLPTCVAHDLHPDFPSTRLANSLDLPQFPIQHHHAHAAALCAEHGHEGPVIALALDGFGLGPGNQSWGGELLLSDGARFERLGHLATLPQPGGDVAAREPWRMASAVLHRLGRGNEIASRFPDITASRMLAHMLETELRCPPTSSAGRLFDAACGLLNIHPVAQFEGQAPMALESMAKNPRVLEGGWSLTDGVLDLLPVLEHLADCADAALGADLFHGTLAEGLANWAIEAALREGIDTIALGGGCFLNKVLIRCLTERLEHTGLRVLQARRVSPGDAGLSLGQAWIAALGLEMRN